MTTHDEALAAVTRLRHDLDNVAALSDRAEADIATIREALAECDLAQLPADKNVSEAAGAPLWENCDATDPASVGRPLTEAECKEMGL